MNIQTDLTNILRFRPLAVSLGSYARKSLKMSVPILILFNKNVNDETMQSFQLPKLLCTKQKLKAISKASEKRAIYSICFTIFVTRNECFRAFVMAC